MVEIAGEDVRVTPTMVCHDRKVYMPKNIKQFWKAQPQGSAVHCVNTHNSWLQHALWAGGGRMWKAGSSCVAAFCPEYEVYCHLPQFGFTLSFGPRLGRTVNIQGVCFGGGPVVQLLCSSVGKPKPSDGFST